MIFAHLLNPVTLEVESVFEDFQRLEWRRQLYKTPDYFEMTINLRQLSAANIRKGTLVGVTANPNIAVISKVFRVEQLLFELDAGGSASEVIRAIGRDASGMFDERVVVPTGPRWDTRTGSAELVMKGYVNNNLGPTAPVVARRIPNFVIAPNQDRGPIIEYNGRYQTLSEILIEIAYFSRLGFEVQFDLTTGNYVFDIVEGVDRSIGQPTVVVFDGTFDTVQKQELITTDIGLKNHAYVGGSGQGPSRTIIQRTFNAAPEPVGYARSEMWIDARELDDDVALQIRADGIMAQMNEEVSVEVTTSQLGQFVYLRDWDLGDIVTVRNDKWGISENVRIVNINHIIQGGSARIDHELMLNAALPALTEKINARIKSIEGGARV